MNKYIRKLGFRGSDDLEMKVTLKAMKYAWLYAMAFIAIWSVVYAYRRSETPIVHVTLMITSYMLYFALQQYFTQKTVRDTEESHENSKRLSSKGKNSYEYVYEEDGKDVYEEVETEDASKQNKVLSQSKTGSITKGDSIDVEWGKKPVQLEPLDGNEENSDEQNNQDNQ